jgi:hypothetical protein
VLLVAGAALCWTFSVAIGVALGLGAWAYTFPTQIVQARRASNEVWAALSASLKPDAVRDWAEPAEAMTWRTPDGSYFDQSTIYLRSTEPGASLVVALDWHDTTPTQLVIQIDGSDVDQLSLPPGRHLLVSRALPGLPVDRIVGIRLRVPRPTGAQTGDVLPLTVQRLYFTRGAAEAALYQTLATGIEQTPSASDQLLATSAEMVARRALADNQAALIATQVELRRTQDVLAAAQAEITRLKNELERRPQSTGTGP